MWLVSRRYEVFVFIFVVLRLYRSRVVGRVFRFSRVSVMVDILGYRLSRV